MRNKAFFLALLPLFLIFSCNSSGGSSEEKFTATINDENWEFYDLTASRNGEDLEIRGKGYLNGDRGAIPVDLTMTIVSVPETDQLKSQTPYTAYFSPNTQETAVHATIEPQDSQLVYDTKLDPNGTGELVITEVEGSSISGEFTFTATDRSGRKLEVTDGKFNGLQL